MRLRFLLISSLSLLLFLRGNAAAAEQAKVIDLWSGTAPGDKQLQLGEEADTTKPSDKPVAGKPVIRLGNVSKPTISVYRPPRPNSNGTAVLVCPGGAYRILAMDLEGTEVCDWLNSLGITAVLLKYRVPKREQLEKHAASLQDAQRALGLVRARASEWGVNPKRIGVLGFSAGGHLAATLSNNYEQRSYPKVDEADNASCRPDFSVLIYPAYLTVKEENDKIAAELAITSNTPPTFITMAADDPLGVESALLYGVALRKASVPVELHIYPTGGHGYGLRPAGDLATTWPQRAAEWMEHLFIK